MTAPEIQTTFMALETAEAPQAVARMLEHNRAALVALERLVRERNPSHFITCARGSSDHAASYFKYLSEIVLGVPCCSIGASVVSIFDAPLKFRDTILITVSQSGQSPDIIAFQENARRAGVPTIAITNNADSPLANAADICLPLSAGAERSVAATKTFIASAAMLAAIVAACSDDRRLRDAVERLPDVLGQAQDLPRGAFEEGLASKPSLYVLGRGPSLPIAQEAALKLKETCGMHAEAYSAAEVMHGPMELVRGGFPIVVFSPGDQAGPTTASTVAHLREAGADIIQPRYVETPHPALDPLTMIQTFYGSAERIARIRGRNPDAPKLLKKVTQTL
jgi:glucosamine--fructose-6-phosphate aminotransferase (isomerizing)